MTNEKNNKITVWFSLLLFDDRVYNHTWWWSWCYWCWMLTNTLTDKLDESRKSKPFILTQNNNKIEFLARIFLLLQLMGSSNSNKVCCYYCCVDFLLFSLLLENILIFSFPMDFINLVLRLLLLLCSVRFTISKRKKNRRVSLWINRCEQEKNPK